MEPSVKNKLKNYNSFTFINKHSDSIPVNNLANLKLLVIKSRITRTFNVAIMHIYASNGNTDDINYAFRPNLTGVIFYTDLGGNLVNGWRYNGGKVTHILTKKEESTQSNRSTLRVNSKVEVSNKALSEPAYCDEYTIAWYERTCYYYTDGSSQCGPWTYTHSTTSNNCPGIGNGGYQFQEKDCAGVINGTAYLDSCGCIGGTTGRTQCPPPCNNFANRVNSVLNSKGVILMILMTPAVLQTEE